MLVRAFRRAAVINPLSTLKPKNFLTLIVILNPDGDSEADVCDHRAGAAIPQPGAPAAGCHGDGASQAGRC